MEEDADDDDGHHHHRIEETTTTCITLSSCSSDEEKRNRTNNTLKKRKLSGRVNFLPKPYMNPHDVHHHPPPHDGRDHHHTHDSTDIPPHHLNTAQTLTCGLVAGCVTRTVVAPLDVIKIILQLKGINGYCVSRTVPGTLLHIYRHEGLKGLWKGNAAGCCRLAPYAATKFLVYDTLKHQTSDLDNGQSFLYGAVAGMAATLTSYPMELVRTKRVVQPPLEHSNRNWGVWSSMRLIYQKEGYRGLYRGSVSALIGVMPFEGIQFGCYEYLKCKSVSQRWPKWRWTEEKERLSSTDYLVLGAVSGLVAQPATYPLDSIKKRLQAQGPGNILYTGMWDCGQKVVRQDGLVGLYRGTLANIVRIIPYSAIMFTTYETLKHFFLHLDERKDQ